MSDVEIMTGEGSSEEKSATATDTPLAIPPELANLISSLVDSAVSKRERKRKHIEISSSEEESASSGEEELVVSDSEDLVGPTIHPKVSKL